MCGNGFLEKLALEFDLESKKYALAGNRTRASRVAGENSTTEPPMRSYNQLLLKLYSYFVDI